MAALAVTSILVACMGACDCKNGKQRCRCHLSLWQRMASDGQRCKGICMGHAEIAGHRSMLAARPLPWKKISGTLVCVAYIISSYCSLLSVLNPALRTCKPQAQLQPKPTKTKRATYIYIVHMAAATITAQQIQDKLTSALEATAVSVQHSTRFLRKLVACVHTILYFWCWPGLLRTVFAADYCCRSL